jgi:hypothetical protein
MRRPKRPSWTTLGVRRGARRLAGKERLGALFRWLRGEAPEVVVFDALNDNRAIVDPAAVDWQSFPLEEAADAARQDEP